MKNANKETGSVCKKEPAGNSKVAKCNTWNEKFTRRKNQWI